MNLPPPERSRRHFSRRGVVVFVAVIVTVAAVLGLIAGLFRFSETESKVLLAVYIVLIALLIAPHLPVGERRRGR